MAYGHSYLLWAMAQSHKSIINVVMRIIMIMMMIMIIVMIMVIIE